MSSTTVTDSSRRFCQGEIYYIIPENETYDPDDFKAGRPAIVISNDMICEFGGQVEVVYLTRHPRNDLPTHVRIMSTGIESWAICDIPAPVSRRRFGKYVNQCSENEMRNIFEALAITYAPDIKNIDRKQLSNILSRWADELENGYAETMNEVFANENPAIRQATTSVQPSETSTTNISTDDANVPQTNAQNVLSDAEIESRVAQKTMQLTAERDMYKTLYNELLEKLVKK